MLLRHKVELAWRANLADFLVARLVRTFRHVVTRQVRNDFERRLDLGIDAPLLVLTGRDRALEVLDFAHQFGGERVVLCGLGLTDILRYGIAARLRVLQNGEANAALLIECGERLRLGRQSPALERGIECAGVVFDPFDVVHG